MSQLIFLYKSNQNNYNQLQAREYTLNVKKTDVNFLYVQFNRSE